MKLLIKAVVLHLKQGFDSNHSPCHYKHRVKTQGKERREFFALLSFVVNLAVIIQFILKKQVIFDEKFYKFVKTLL